MRSTLAFLLAGLALAAPAAAQQQHYQDLSSRDAAPSRQDLRSPDTRDAARPQPTPSPAPVQSSDTPWALVGGGLGALLLGGAAVRRRRLRLRVA